MTRELTAYEKAGVAANEADDALKAAYADYHATKAAYNKAYDAVGRAAMARDAARREARRLALAALQA